ncbi:MAG TPA: acyl-CoA thioesterase domain-containing protein, partial [Nocardioides sp.]
MTLQDTRPRLTVAQRISPERLGAREFRGPAHPGPSTRSFGGEVAAQAIHAAALTVPEDRSIHTAHTWFLLPGDTSLPVDYTVRDVRDGGSFTTRSVDATQGDRVIFTMTASFQRPEAGLEHQVGEVRSPAPEELPPPEEMLPPGENLDWIQSLEEMS